MQVFYTYVDNFLDRKNKRKSYFYASFQNCGVLKTPQAQQSHRPGDPTVLKRFFRDNFIIFSS